MVRMNTKLRDMNVAVEANDERAIEVLATGLPLHQGAQLAVDITQRSALTATGLATPGAAHIDGIVLQRARADKERTGGRWSSEAVDFVSQLAGHKAWQVLRGSAFFAWLRRCQRMLSMSCARAFACSLVRSRSCLTTWLVVRQTWRTCLRSGGLTCCFLCSHSLTD